VLSVGEIDVQHGAAEPRESDERGVANT